MNPPDVDTWYVLADGTKAHPAEVSAGEDGVLKHKNGVPVALREGGLPLTTGDANKTNALAAELGKQADDQAKADAGKKPGKAEKPAKAKPGDTPAETDREIKPGEGTATYETR